MLRFDDIKHMYLATEVVDLRKGINGYAILVKEVLGKDPYDDSLYIFTNSHHNKIKCLYYDGKSFWLLYKRLEKGTFKWVKKADGSSVMISQQQLKWLLEGLTIYQEKAFKETKYKYI